MNSELTKYVIDPTRNIWLRCVYVDNKLIGHIVQVKEACADHFSPLQVRKDLVIGKRGANCLRTFGGHPAEGINNTAIKCTEKF
jgi:hypothetical protein